MESKERPLEERLEKAYGDMLVVLEEAISELLEADKEVRKIYSEDKEVPEVVSRVFRRALEKKVDRIFKRAVLPSGLKVERVEAGVLAGGRLREGVLAGGRALEADWGAAYWLADKAGFSPNLVLETAQVLENTASELLQAIEDARRVALRVGRRCLESPAMKEIARRAALRRMQKA
jgi:hypothetical protein